MNKIKHVKLACYSMNISMALVGNLPPILFLTFRTLYGVSYTLLGLLVLINFLSQLAIDLIFSFFSHKFNISKTVKIMPWLAVFGFALYALSPALFPDAPFAGLALGTIVFSAASGLAEVLLSPIIAALPADDPDRSMSALHSVFAWGVVGVVSFSSLFLFAFGLEKWQILVAVVCAMPLVSAILFAGAEIPKLETPEKTSGAIALLKNPVLWICVAAIFLGGALELIMSQWASGYLEQAMGVPKVQGDILGVAMFGVALATGRTLYAKFGKKIELVLILGALGAAICYLTAATTMNAAVGMLACALTGFFVSMMWPGSLVVASAKFPHSGVFVFAMMAAGGDFGAATAPQLVGIITDVAMKNKYIIAYSQNLNLSPEQLSIKLGMLLGFLLSCVAIPIYLKIFRMRENAKSK